MIVQPSFESIPAPARARAPPIASELSCADNTCQNDFMSDVNVDDDVDVGEDDEVGIKDISAAAGLMHFLPVSWHG